jgi:hypothetical protein
MAVSFSDGLCPLRRFEQVPGRHIQGLSQALNVGKRDVPARSLNRRHIGPIQLALQSQSLLGPPLLHPKQAHPVPKNLAEIVGIGQTSGT